MINQRYLLSWTENRFAESGCQVPNILLKLYVVCIFGFVDTRTSDKHINVMDPCNI